MRIKKNLPRKSITFYILFGLLVSVIYTFIEFYSIFIMQVEIPGITNNLFYLYVFMIESAIFSFGLYFKSQNNLKYISYTIVGGLLSIIISILNILIILAHFLLSIYPINNGKYTLPELIKELSMILLIGLISIPFVIDRSSNFDTG